MNVFVKIEATQIWLKLYNSYYYLNQDKTIYSFLPNKAAAGHKHYKSPLSFSQVCCLLPPLISWTKKKQIFNTID